MVPRTVIVGLGLLLVACGIAGEDSRAEPPAENMTSTSDTPTTTAPGTTTTSEAEMEDEFPIVEEATRDLAARLGIPEGDIEVVQVREVMWPDGALGCPEEGKMYTQAVVDGTQVLLGFDERIYDYHAGADGDPFLCPSDEKDGGYDFIPPPRFDES